MNIYSNIVPTNYSATWHGSSATLQVAAIIEYISITFKNRHHNSVMHRLILEIRGVVLVKWGSIFLLFFEFVNILCDFGSIMRVL